MDPLLGNDRETNKDNIHCLGAASAPIDWLEKSVFCALRADGYARNNGYNNEER
jgi:hypothetical protein